MDESLNIKLLRSNFLFLGGTKFWDWKENSVSVPYWRTYWHNALGGYIKVDGHKIALGPDKIVVLPPQTVYCTGTYREVGHFYVHFSCGKPFSEIEPRCLIFQNKELLEQASAIARDLQETPNSPRLPIKVQKYICSILLALPNSVIPPPIEYDPRIDRALREIKSNPGISNNGLSKIVGMSRNGFLQLFSREIGVAPQTYSRKWHLNEACMLLHFGDTPIKEIAVSAGFYDRYHFTRAFKKEFGVGPAEYRKGHKSL